MAAVWPVVVKLQLFLAFNYCLMYNYQYLSKTVNYSQ
jgi:hypothetical protein